MSLSAKKPRSVGPCSVILLAAGLGKRMRSELPKVLHELSGQPLIHHILDRVAETLSEASIAIVVGHRREQVEAAVKQHPLFSSGHIEFVYQSEQKGTGHAVRCAMESSWGQKCKENSDSVMVLPGDQPLIPGDLLFEMSQKLARSEALRFLSCEVPEPKGYGRVVRRGKSGPVLRIVEEKDAKLREQEIQEVSMSIYLFRTSFLSAGLNRISDKNAQAEYYLTDLIELARRQKKDVDVLKWADFESVLGVNDLWELSQMSHALNRRVIRDWAKRGVQFEDPNATWIDVGVQLNEGVRISAGAHLRKKTVIGPKTQIGPGVVLENVQVGAGCEIRTGTVGEDSQIADEAMIGPYAHLRPGSEVGTCTKIGNFVELKKSKIGANSSIAHLSYVGDAEVGDRVNIGCGFVTCNYDGRVIDGNRKHRTVIEDDVFLGSDCQVVAPVVIGQGAYVASGSTITEDVESDALAIARSKQVNKPGYARKLRAK